jgi:hypothetical protein
MTLKAAQLLKSLVARGDTYHAALSVKKSEERLRLLLVWGRTRSDLCFLLHPPAADCSATVSSLCASRVTETCGYMSKWIDGCRNQEVYAEKVAGRVLTDQSAVPRSLRPGQRGLTVLSVFSKSLCCPGITAASGSGVTDDRYISTGELLLHLARTWNEAGG